MMRKCLFALFLILNPLEELAKKLTIGAPEK